jgi:serine/threonine protein kinase
MTASSSDQVRRDALSAEAAEALAANLVAEMIRRWREGERLLPEYFLEGHPELWDHPEAAADLIYEELCLRQEYGPEVPVEQVLERFPQWRPQLEVLFDCQRVLGPRPVPHQFPSAGEYLGDFMLLAELGRGAQGRVFLATQQSLGERPVVLKVTPCEAREHLSLARLQHTHIVPLYSVQDQLARGLRALCMPYFGGATLAQLLDDLAALPPAQRTGQDLLVALDALQAAAPFGVPTAGPARRALARASYVEAVCWVGTCLADALHYAHERGLVHLDLKPSNVLLAADGTPMLLDFHLAQEPLQPDSPAVPWLGGTSGYMSPEQRAALWAVSQGRAVPGPVDRHSDVYSLAVVLFEALASRPLIVDPRSLASITEMQPSPAKEASTTLPQSPRAARKQAQASLDEQEALADPAAALRRCNGHVSVGLADVIGRCLADDPADRYPDMASLAADLRRHLAHLPLDGVRNRSLRERWQKWRRRRPHGVALAGMTLAVVTAAVAVGLGAASYFGGRAEQARAALKEGRIQAAAGQWDGAVQAFQRGLKAARDVPLQGDLAAELEQGLHRAEQGQAAAERDAARTDLHRLTDQVRFLYGANHVRAERLPALAASCRALWDNRARIVERLGEGGTATVAPAVRDDLLDLAIFWADLQVRLAPPSGKDGARRDARAVLAQAESLFGSSPVLDAERVWHGGEPRPVDCALPTRRAEATAWEHYALARALLRAGDVDRAADEAARAVRMQPQGLWPNFYEGLCAYRRGRYADAATAFSVCIGAAPQAAGAFYNRGLALAALGEADAALRDYDEALRLDPSLAGAALSRGLLQLRLKRYAAAAGDLRRARAAGADPAATALGLALVSLARGEPAAALDDLRRGLSPFTQPPQPRQSPAP